MLTEEVPQELSELDAALTAVVKQFNAKYPHLVFWYRSVNCKPAQKQKQARIAHSGDTQIVKKDPE